MPADNSEGANIEGAAPRYLRPPEASRLVGLSISCLEKHRVYGTGPRYSKLGGRIVYRCDELLRWVDDAAKASTSDPAKAAVLAAKPIRRPNKAAGRTDDRLPIVPRAAGDQRAAPDLIGVPGAPVKFKVSRARLDVTYRTQALDRFYIGLCNWLRGLARTWPINK